MSEKQVVVVMKEVEFGGEHAISGVSMMVSE